MWVSKYMGCSVRRVVLLAVGFSIEDVYNARNGGRADGVLGGLFLTEYMGVAGFLFMFTFFYFLRHCVFFMLFSSLS